MPGETWRFLIAGGWEIVHVCVRACICIKSTKERIDFQTSCVKFL